MVESCVESLVVVMMLKECQYLLVKSEIVVGGGGGRDGASREGNGGRGRDEVKGLGWQTLDETLTQTS